MTGNEVACPEWCTEAGEHTTHRKPLTIVMRVGGRRHEGIQINAVLEAGRRHKRVELVISRGRTEVMRFVCVPLIARDIGQELIDAADAVATLPPSPS